MPNRTEHSRRAGESPIKTALMLLLITAILIIAFPFLIPGMVRGLLLRLSFQQAARAQGKFVLFVYSDSTAWKSYVEHNILPRLQPHTLILNWSQRAKWNNGSWEVKAVRHWGGDREFNPMAVVFCNLFRVRTIRFYRAFREYKRGRTQALREAEAELFGLVESRTSDPKPQHAA
jgi:hypothetical protein